MNSSEYSNYVRCQQLMEQPLTNGYGENYIVAAADDAVISNYSMSFRKRGYAVDVIDLTTPTQSTVAYNVFHQVKARDDAKWLARQLDAPWLQDDPYWFALAVELISCFVQVLKHTDHNANISALVEIINELHLGVTKEGAIPSHIDRLISAIKTVDPNNEIVRDWDFISTLPLKTLKEACRQSCSMLHLHFRYVDCNIADSLPDFDPCSLVQNKSVLFVRVAPGITEQTNCAGIIFKQISKALYDYLREQETTALPIRTNFVCGPNIFQSQCSDILGDSAAPLLGLHLIFALPDIECCDVPRVLDRALK